MSVSHFIDLGNEASALVMLLSNELVVARQDPSQHATPDIRSALCGAVQTALEYAISLAPASGASMK